MNRILILLLSFPGAALAGESLAAPDGSDAAEVHAAAAGEPAKAPDGEKGVRGGDSRAVPRAKSGADGADHLPSPSWRSYLPGMLR